MSTDLQHVFLKFKEENPDYPAVSSTMLEHISIDMILNGVIWGHFTSKPNLNGPSSKQKLRLEEQIKNGYTTYVFFYNSTNKLLYVAELVAVYNRNDDDLFNHELVPEYYRELIGKKPDPKVENRLPYVFFEVRNIRPLDFEQDAPHILGVNSNEPLVNCKGSASLFYCKLEAQFEDELKHLYVPSTTPKQASTETDEAPLRVGKVSNVTVIDNTPTPQKEETSPKGPKKPGSNNTDYSEQQKNNQKLGDVGEALIMKHEKERLLSIGRQDLSDKVEQVSKTIGNGAGYDIRSYTDQGEIKYIEVKCTKGNENTAFFITDAEVEFSKQNADNYYLYRLYNYDPKTGNAQLFIQQGNMEEKFNLKPRVYSVTK